MAETLLEIRNLQTHIATDRGVVRALDGVSIDVAKNETLAIVGESGCGKTVLALSVLGLTPSSASVEGEILFEGVDLASRSSRELRAYRGRRIGMIFQDPGTSLNPVRRVGDQIAETIRAHESISRAEARRRSVEWLDRVRIAGAGSVARRYPHELSGGMKQRVMIAMALAPRPSLLIADEPTTAVDVTTQAAILELLATLRAETGISVLFISHDLTLVAKTADRVAVLYAGRIVEMLPADRLFEHAQHPYTRCLLTARPTGPRDPEAPLAIARGHVPDGIDIPPGCAFHPRCVQAVESCRRDVPSLVERESTESPSDADSTRAHACACPVVAELDAAQRVQGGDA